MTFIDMTYIFLSFSFILLNGFFLIFLYFDLTYRRVPIKFFKYSYVTAFILNIFEYLFFFKKIAFFLFLKALILMIVLFFSLILFFLKIVGGSDGKLFILIFIIHPIVLLNLFTIFIFFLAFSLFFILIFIINGVSNNIFKDNYTFLLFFNFHSKISILKKVYLKLFYKFLNYSELCDYRERKYLLKSLGLIFNIRKNRFQTLCQIRPPLIIAIILAYYTLIYLKIAI